jgi:two-component sensor histidine kinase/HAMP domain-containing protein
LKERDGASARGRSLLPRLIATIAAVLSLSTFALGGAAVAAQRRLLLEGLETKAERNADYLAVSLAYPVWNLVGREIDGQLERVFVDPEAYALSLEMEGLAAPPIRLVRAADGSVAIGDPDPAEPATVERREVTQEGRRIATLELRYTRRLVAASMLAASASIAVLFLSVLLLLVAALVLLLRYDIVLPLRRIERWAADVNTGSAASPLDRTGFRGEIASLGASVERMTTLLEERFRRIQAGEREYRSLFESSPIPAWEFDFSPLRSAPGVAAGAFPSGAEALRSLFAQVRLRSANTVALAAVGASSAEASLERLAAGADEAVLDVFGAELAALARGGGDAGGEGSVLLSTGEERSFLFRFAALPAGDPGWKRVLLAAADITERVRADRSLRAALAEKELLAGELFHRTRNTLQLLSSMISLRESRSEARSAAELRGIGRSVRTLSMVQDKLLESGDLSSIELGAFLGDLALHIAQEAEPAFGRMRVVMEAENIPALIDAAVPLGLVLCELAANAAEHAFPDGRVGSFFVRLKRRGDGRLILQARDDGVGPPPGFDPRAGAGLGLTTAIALAEGQLGGRMDFDFSSGFSVELSFDDSTFTRRV